MGDLDGDGKVDIVWRDLVYGDVHVWLMNGLGLNAGSGFVGAASPTTKVAGVADYDGDGRADILLQSTNGTVSVWLMSGSSVKAGSGAVGTLSSDWQIVRP